MELHTQRLTIEEYAHISSLQGKRIRLVGSVYWNEVRRFFYRPLISYAALETTSVIAPFRGFGGYQHVVDDQRNANSTINFRVYDGFGAYSLAAQGREFRRMVRIATKHFEVRPVKTSNELKKYGHGLYMSFYERTKYEYLSKRIQRQNFDKWADTLFISPKVIVLGAYVADELQSVAVCYWISDVLLYSTSFSNTASLKWHVCDLMLHAVRELVAGQSGISKIVAGMYAGGIGSDHFDLLRGGRIERRPARYVTCPALTVACLRTLRPGYYRKLTGDF